MIPFKIEQLPRTLREDVERYLEAHPWSPAARLRPQIGLADGVWFAFTGQELRDGGVGVGSSPRDALEDFGRHFRGEATSGESLSQELTTGQGSRTDEASSKLSRWESFRSDGRNKRSSFWRVQIWRLRPKLVDSDMSIGLRVLHCQMVPA